MLWIGPSLGALERACMRSALRQGHRLTLYCYQRPRGVPEGVELADAAEVAPADRIVRHQHGSVALFSNYFRYRLQQLGRGLWLDCDAYLLAPIEAEGDYLFGEEAPGRINGGVLRLPRDAPMLEPLIALFEERIVPDWLPWRARMAARWRLACTGRAGLSRMPWGVAGPLAMTATARRCGVAGRALPPDVFYPVRWQDAGWIRDPSVRLEAAVTPRTVAVHLWNERIKAFKDAPAAPGSFLARLQAEGRA